MTTALLTYLENARLETITTCQQLDDVSKTFLKTGTLPPISSIAVKIGAMSTYGRCTELDECGDEWRAAEITEYGLDNILD